MSLIPDLSDYDGLLLRSPRSGVARHSAAAKWGIGTSLVLLTAATGLIAPRS